MKSRSIKVCFSLAVLLAPAAYADAQSGLEASFNAICVDNYPNADATYVAFEAAGFVDVDGRFVSQERRLVGEVAGRNSDDGFNCTLAGSVEDIEAATDDVKAYITVRLDAEKPRRISELSAEDQAAFSFDLGASSAVLGVIIPPGNSSVLALSLSELSGAE